MQELSSMHSSLTVFLLQIFVSTQNTLILPEVETFLQRFIIPAAIILITGIIDDRYELKSWIKLIAQIAAGAILYFEGVGITHIFVYQLPPVLSLIITVFWSVMIINAFNLIDGLDGIAAGLAAISSFLLAIWTLLCGNSNAMFLIQLIFCGCCLGFLRYNFSPAKIFMGDTGSMFLGLFFAYVSMQYSTKSITIAALLVPLAAVGLPMFDVMLAIWRRIFRKYVQKDPNSDIMKGDHDHLHHRILKQSGSTRKTAYIMYLLSLTISIFAMLGAFLESHIPALTFVLLLLALFVMIRYSNIELFDTLTSVATGFHRPHRNFVLTALHPLLDAIIVFVSFWISRIVCKNFLPDPASGLWILSHITPFILFLCFSGIYRTFWLRVGIIQYYKLIRLLIIAGITGYIINSLICIYGFDMNKSEMWKVGGFYIIFMLFTVALILSERFLIHYYESFGYRRLFISNQGKKSDLPKVLIYGGGIFARLYITSQYCDFKKERQNVKIIGIMDDDKALSKLNVYGFDVVGTVDDLQNIFDRYKFNIIVITCDADDNVLQKLKDFCQTNNVSLQNFICRTDDLI